MWLDRFEVYQRLYSVVESDIKATLQKAKVASKEKNRASAVALNAEIRRIKARLLEEVPKLQTVSVCEEGTLLVSAILFFSSKMAEVSVAERPLFGGAIASSFPLRFQDVSNIRQVPDHQEVFVDPTRDESLIFEILDFKHDVGDNGSAAWFLQDLANEQDAEGATLIEQSGVVEAPGLCYRSTPAIITTAVGEMAISKGRQGREAQNIIKVYLANLRLKEVGTDVLVTVYEPLLINPLSESAPVIGAGLTVPATQSGLLPMSEVFKLAVSSFKVNDWCLFGAVA